MEQVYQTWQRITGKSWSEAKSGGFTTGTSQDNLALQKKLLSGWNPYTTPVGSLEKTLPPVNDESGGVSVAGGVTLPQASGNSLSAFQSVMKEVMNKAAGKAKKKGLNVMGDRMAGLRMPGSSLASIMDIVEGQATGGFKNIYESTMNYMTEQKSNNWRQLQLVISEDALPNFKDDEIKDLAIMNGLDPAYLMGVKLAQKARLDRLNAPTATEQYKTLRAKALTRLNEIGDEQYKIDEEVSKEFIKKKELEIQDMAAEIYGQPKVTARGVVSGLYTFGIGAWASMRGVNRRKDQEVEKLYEDLDYYRQMGVYSDPAFQLETEKRYKAEELDMNSMINYLDKIGVKPKDVGITLDDPQKQAQKELSDLRASKALPMVDDATLKDLAINAGYDPNVILAIKAQQVKDQK